MQHDTIPVTVIGGYLGSGKTTLLNTLLRGTHGLRLAVLVNDFGSINIDADLIAAHRGDTISLTNGCICCSLQDNLGSTFYALAQRSDPPDHVVIEASGVADPWRIARYAQSIPGLHLDGIIVLVDAEMIRRQARDKYVGDTVMQQVRAADLLVLSKTDLVTPATVQEVRAWLVAQAPGARMIEAVAGQLPSAIILGRMAGHDVPAPLPVQGRVHAHRHADHAGPAQPDDDDLHAVAFTQVSFASGAPFDRAALTRALGALPPGVARGKGVLYLADAPDRRVILQLVGKRWELQPGEPWAGAEPASRLVFIAPRGQMEGPEILASLTEAVVDHANKHRL